MQEILKHLHHWMNEYIKGFYTQDEEIMLGIHIKEVHTFHVTANMLALAQHLGRSEREVKIAEIIGLFHDVGRFRQYALYQTFNDTQSEDHADLGLKVLKEERLLEELSEEEQDLIYFAIENHNKKEIARTTDDRKRLFARMIRDADKLDIYRVLAPYLSDMTGEKGPRFISSLTSRYPSPDFVEILMAGQQADYHRIRTHGDRKLVRLLWVYDISFSWTMRRLHERGYIDRVIKSLPHGREMTLGFLRLKNYMREKCRLED